MLTKAMKIAKDGITIKDLDMNTRTAVIAQATYQSKDREGDVANKGMFTRSWNNNRSDIRLFKNHNKYSGPGRVDDFWEDEQHGYVKSYYGTHTEGNDTLIQIDEGIIIAASFGYNPVVAPKLKDSKGYDLKEVQWLETSVLTHWGAHKDSGVVAVKKHFDFELQLKELNETEKNFFRQLIANRQESLRLCVAMNDTVTEGNDLWSYINELIGEQSYNLAWLKRRLEYGVKEVDDLRSGIKAMEKFIHNTKASDECIQRTQTELENTKQLLSEIESVTTHDPVNTTRDPAASKEDNEFLKQINYSLLKVNTL
jgi:HK97 family phage prohead protease